MTWEEMANEQIERVQEFSLADQVEILRHSLISFGQAVDRSDAAHRKYISDRISEVDAQIAARNPQANVTESLEQVSGMRTPQGEKGGTL